MIIANVAPGLYLIIDEDKVVAKIIRKFKWVSGFKYTDGYDLQWTRPWLNGETLVHYNTLTDIASDYAFDNYPGYNAILKKQKRIYK